MEADQDMEEAEEGMEAVVQVTGIRVAGSVEAAMEAMEEMEVQTSSHT